MYMNIIKQNITKIRAFWRSKRLYDDIKMLKDKNPTILSQNCYGGIFSHDYKMKFMSPTVNLYFSTHDFIEFCENIQTYINIPLIEDKTLNKKYPVGKLNELTIHFVHYATFEEANKKWKERCERIDLNNLYIMMSDRDGCTAEDLVKFDNLKCENKVAFVHKLQPEISSSWYVKGYEEAGEVGNIFKWKGLFGKRLWDDCDFDFADFINCEEQSPLYYLNPATK